MKAFIVGSALAVLLTAGAAVAAPDTVKEAVKACCEAMEKCCCCEKADKSAGHEEHKAH